MGASDHQADQKILVFPSNTGAAEIYSPAGFPTSIGSRIHDEVMVKIDQVDNVLPIDARLDFALIDVEKMEVEALLGMKKIIERS